MRFAIIGTSWIAAAFVAAARTVPGVELAAVCSRSAERAAEFGAEHGVPTAHAGLAALAGDREVDAVYVATPNAQHAAQAVAMLRAGKHVLVEKPMACTAAEGAAMAEAARAAGRLLMEAYVSPFLPNVAAVRDALPALGPLRRAVLVKDQYSSKYDQLKSGGLPNAFNPAQGGGSLLDLGVYPVALALHLFGDPTSVVATGTVLGSGADAQGTILLGFDGFEAVCLHSKIAPCAIASGIAGEDGALSLDDCSAPTQVTLHRRVGRPGAATAPGFHRQPGSPEDLTRPQSPHHMRYEIEAFAGLVAAGATEATVHPPSRSVAALGILDEARRQVLARR